MIPEFKFALREDIKNRKEFLPTRSESKATGWDVRCAEPEGAILKPFEHCKIKLGFRAMPPEGYWFELKPRSSTFGKKHLHCLYGTIDETFEGELLLAFQYIPSIVWKPVTVLNISRQLELFNNIEYYRRGAEFLPGEIMAESALRVDFGDRIAQIIPVRRQEMSVIDVSNEEIDKFYKERNESRGAGGFGSTGDGVIQR